MFGFWWVAAALAGAPAELQDALSLPPGEVHLTDEPRVGKKKAPYTVLQISDFACPHCAAAFPQLIAWVQTEPKVQLRFSTYPLTGECNPNVGRTGDRHRCNAAAGAWCAEQQHQFLPVATALFNAHGEVDTPVRNAVRSSTDSERWNACLVSPEAWNAVVEGTKLGADLQITGTPTFFVRGILGKEWVQVSGGVDTVKAVVEAHRSGVRFDRPAPTAE